MRMLRIVLLVTVCLLAIYLFDSAEKKDLNLIEWTHADNFKLPQEVINFFYNYDDKDTALFHVLDAAYTTDEKFTEVSKLTETHYIIHINHKALNIRQRDFKGPYLIFSGRLYFSKTHFLVGKLRVPQDLAIYYVDLKKVLNQ